jgi:hypothetical protein
LRYVIQATRGDINYAGLPRDCSKWDQSGAIEILEGKAIAGIDDPDERAPSFPKRKMSTGTSLPILMKPRSLDLLMM